MGSGLSGSDSGSLLVLSVSVVGILFTSILLLACYLFLACSFSCRRRRRHSHQTAPTPLPSFFFDTATTDQPRRGLEEAAIRRIPTLRYQHQHQHQHKQQQCGVCLADFREGERLRRLTPCHHSFHIDCIDAWLAAALTCPLCRAHVVLATRSQDHHIDAFSSAAAADDTTSSVCTTRQPDHHDPLLSGVHQPMRRSLSLDSCADNHLYLALRTIILQGSKPAVSARTTRRLRRSSSSFSHARTSPTPILPI